MTALHLMPLALTAFSARLISFLILGFFAVLFLQSGLDKITDRNGNLEWLKGHFANSPLKNMVPILLSILTILEICSGVAATAAAVFVIFMEMDQFWIPFAAVSLCAFTLLTLFSGQRMAKDYAGAAGIVPYFIVAIGAMIWFGFFIVH